MVMVVLIVPAEEGSAEGLGVLDAATAGGAETSVGLRPSSFSAPPAVKVSLVVVRGMTMAMFHLRH
jgi:hypothetical protein